jgi:hypothetical protein
MTYLGRVKNGVAILETPDALPEGTRVRVEVEPAESEFWLAKSVETLAEEQGVLPVKAIGDLVIDWPQDESIDEFLALVR